ncbi:DUF5330 domain-containing protein [Ancylobacter mangrovi]|uniref:DUF5330 domain-containing protein n=1 Tax=Ancylobacter mangrovi TaxID=2972472 RepID=A0A9X2T5S9_9HYPH|nr:DUF5330 domain-containing protein [Ancylobacter mangrovi]MCS0494213.1 DUF5330 domain-containing protein [Ancylobacter mangrovi]MCS0501060.1 DUF5330 domain-containing protein [Ancylobacter mangrovi]
MFFLLRVGFWLTIVFLLLPGVPGAPSQESAEGAGAPRLGTAEALSAATSAVADAGGFCERQPHACAVGAQLFELIGRRAEAGARYALSYLVEQISEEKRKAAVRSAGAPADDTLTTHDLAPEWQGPVRPALDATATDLIFSPPAQPVGAPAATTPGVPRPPKKPA